MRSVTSRWTPVFVGERLGERKMKTTRQRHRLARDQPLHSPMRLALFLALIVIDPVCGEFITIAICMS